MGVHVRPRLLTGEVVRHVLGQLEEDEGRHDGGDAAEAELVQVLVTCRGGGRRLLREAAGGVDM